MTQKRCSDKRVVFLIRNVASDSFGGGEVYQLRLAEKLKKAGFEPFILTNSKKLIKTGKASGIKVLVPPYIKRQNWSGIWNLGLPLYCVYQLRLKIWYKNIFKQYRPSVVNIQSRDDFLAATRAARELGIRILWTDHADLANWVLKNVNVRLKNTIGKKIIKYARYADTVIFVGEEIERETRELIKPKTISHARVITNGVDDRYGDYRKIKGVKNSFLYIGRLVEEKGLHELMAAFSIVKEKYPDSVLNIYGDGDEKMFSKMAQSNAISFYRYPDEPLKVMAENEVFVLPSYREGLSLALLDAAMMKKKIIASDVDGNPEVVVNKETGLLVPPKNVEALAEAMIYMLKNNDSAEKMAKNARKLYEEKYNFEKIFNEKMLPLYNIEKE